MSKRPYLASVLFLILAQSYGCVSASQSGTGSDTGGTGGAGGGTGGTRSDAGPGAGGKTADAAVASSTRSDALVAHDLLSPDVADLAGPSIDLALDRAPGADGAVPGDVLPATDGLPALDLPGVAVDASTDAPISDALADVNSQIPGSDAGGSEAALSCSNSCDDGLACTTDSCVAGGCQNAIQAGSCVIDKVCYADGDPNPTDACKGCVITGSTKAWSSLPEGSSCGTGKSCQAGACTACGNVGQACCGTGASATCVSGAACNASKSRCEIDKATSLAGAYDTFCALFQSGRVRCWGGGSAGLGNGNSGGSNVAAAPVSGLTDAAQISVGTYGACAVRATGAVVCWGQPTALSATSKTPTAIPTITNASQVTIGWNHACVRTTQGKVLCWGSNDYGQLGDGTVNGSATPVEMQGVSDARQVAAASHSRATCVLRSTGQVACVGEAGSNGQTAQSLTIQDLPSVSSASSIISVEYSTCAILTTGGANCWDGGLLAPTVMQGLGQPVAVARWSYNDYAGEAAVQQDGTLWLRGPGPVIGTGIATRISSPSHASAVLLGDTNPATNVVGVARAEQSICMLRSDGGVYCAGSGKIGDGQADSPAFRNYFVPVVGILPVASEAGQCSDGLDNDGNGKTDLDDPACAQDLGSAVGSSVASAPFGAVFGNYLKEGCNPNAYGGSEAVLTWTAPSGGTYQFDTAGSGFDTVLAVFKGNPAFGSELSCNDDKIGVTDGSSAVQMKVTTGDKLTLVVDSKSDPWGGTAVSFNLNITKQ
jgi:hypothetical protein